MSSEGFNSRGLIHPPVVCLCRHAAVFSMAACFCGSYYQLFCLSITISPWTNTSPFLPTFPTPVWKMHVKFFWSPESWKRILFHKASGFMHFPHNLPNILWWQKSNFCIQLLVMVATNIWRWLASYYILPFPPTQILLCTYWSMKKSDTTWGFNMAQVY